MRQFFLEGSNRPVGDEAVLAQDLLPDRGKRNALARGLRTLFDQSVGCLSYVLSQPENRLPESAQSVLTQIKQEKGIKVRAGRQAF